MTDNKEDIDDLHAAFSQIATRFESKEYDAAEAILPGTIQLGRRLLRWYIKDSSEHVHASRTILCRLYVYQARIFCLKVKPCFYQRFISDLII